MTEVETYVFVTVTTRSGAMEAPPRKARMIMTTAMIENQGFRFVTFRGAGWVGRREVEAPHDAQNFAFGKSWPPHFAQYLI